ncbi:MAG: N-formylglutamate amidohydrolase [Demequinaceae bacterium]|nr:N-formylglutamate amidohydrolase [Demequinaceae bacterium]
MWDLIEGQQPIAAVAIHDGHAMRDEVARTTALTSAERLREEDPGTSIFASVAGTQIVVRRSRFEVDLNRPREAAVYVVPEDAWGLDLWVRKPRGPFVARSLAEYDAFYAEAHRVFSEMEHRFGRFVVFDMHSYNHRRNGPEGEPEDPSGNPEINVGTGTLDRERWGPLVDRFISDLRGFDYFGRSLDVRENVRFRGGHFSGWVHENFPDSACCLAIEFKKIFMDEWTGESFPEEHEALAQAISASLPGVFESLDAMGSE